jgi:glycosyltransferase involved in cell wall biosynthesis
MMGRLTEKAGIFVNTSDGLPAARRHPVLYVLHSSQLYGTERMALATAEGLADEFETILFGPPGPALVEAERLGFQTREYRSCKDLAYVLMPLLSRYQSLTFVGTGPRYHIVCIALNAFYGRRIKHVQIVHGGTGTYKDIARNLQKDYSRKRMLNFFDISFVAVSEWSKQQLIDFGVRNRIEVVSNFIPSARIADIPKRPVYSEIGARNVLVVSRIDHIKRVDLLLDALDRRKSDLCEICFRILGSGPEFDNLKERARRAHPNVEFVGFSENVAGEMTKADLLLHLCPVEPFGLVVLEAMAAHLAAMVPDQGGAASLVRDNISGFTFRANDAEHLAQRLIEAKNTPADLLNRMVLNADLRVQTEFSAESSLRRYRELFAPAESSRRFPTRSGRVRSAQQPALWDGEDGARHRAGIVG